MALVLVGGRFFRLVVEYLQAFFGESFQEEWAHGFIRQVAILDGQQAVQVIALRNARDVALGGMAHQSLLVNSRCAIVFQIVLAPFPKHLDELTDGGMALHGLLVR